MPPSSIPPPVVEHVEAKQDGDKLTLTWPVPTGPGDNELAGFYVYRFKEKREEPSCKDCPVRFDRIAEIAHDKLTSGFSRKIVYSEILDPGYRYKFRVSSFSIYGEEGSPSETIDINE